MKGLFICSFLLICIGCGHRTINTTGNTDSTSKLMVEAEECNDTAALHKIQKALTLPDVVDMTPEDFAEQNADTPLQGLQWIKIDTNFNQHCLLGITVTGEWSAAYIQGFTNYLLFDKRTGNKLMIKDLLKEDNLAALSRQLYQEIKEVAKVQRKEVETDTELNEYLAEYDAQANVSAEDINAETLENFHLRKDGITFTYEFGFGHAFWVIEPPDAELTLSVNELKPYIKPGGPLSFWLEK